MKIRLLLFTVSFALVGTSLLHAESANATLMSATASGDKTSSAQQTTIQNQNATPKDKFRSAMEKAKTGEDMSILPGNIRAN